MPRRNRRRRPDTWEQRERTAQQAQKVRLAERRRAKELAIEAAQPEAAQSAVQRYRDAKAKRIAAGKPVLKTLAELQRETPRKRGCGCGENDAVQRAANQRADQQAQDWDGKPPRDADDADDTQDDTDDEEPA